jgi:hypothetical protein
LAADRVISVDRELPGLRTALRERAEDGDDEAVRVLTSWGEWHPFTSAPAQTMVDRLLAHPVGQPRMEFPIGVLAPHGARLLHTALGACGGELMSVQWRKRRWRCRAAHCPQQTFTEQVLEVPVGMRTTTRLRTAGGGR